MEDALKLNTLKCYLREFYVKPDLSDRLWGVAKACMENQKASFYAIKFPDDLSMKQFALAVLLSSGKQYNWGHFNSFSVVQDNLDEVMHLSDYVNFDVVFISHIRGGMQNKLQGQVVNQISILRAPRKTFFFDRGGHVLTDLASPLVTLSDLAGFASRAKVSNGDNL